MGICLNGILKIKREIWLKGNLKAKARNCGKREFSLKFKTGNLPKREFKKLKREKVAKGNLKVKTRNCGKREFKQVEFALKLWRFCPKRNIKVHFDFKRYIFAF